VLRSLPIFLIKREIEANRFPADKSAMYRAGNPITVPARCSSCLLSIPLLAAGVRLRLLTCRPEVRPAACLPESPPRSSCVSSPLPPTKSANCHRQRDTVQITPPMVVH